MRYPAAAALLCVAAAFLVACGDEDSRGSDTAGAESSERSAYLVRASNICGRRPTGPDQVSANFGAAFPGPDAGAAEWESFLLEELVPQVGEQVEAIRELAPPAGDEEAVEEILSAMEEGATAVENDAAAIAAELTADPAAAFTGGLEPFADANQLAQEYGLHACRI